MKSVGSNEVSVSASLIVDIPPTAPIIDDMAKAHKPRTDSRRGRPSRRVVEAIPLAATTAAARRRALKFDKLVGSDSLKGKPLATLQSQIVGATIRELTARGGTQLFDFRRFPAGFSWPDTLYVPRDQRSVGIPKPPTSRLYSDAWIDGGGVSNADANTGALFTYAGARTTDAAEVGDAGVGITFSPQNALSYVRFEPELNCAVTYRAFVDLWPQLIAGSIRVGASLIMAAWERSPVLSGSYELLRWREVTVFDTGSLDAGSQQFPDVLNMFQRTFSNSDLATTFLLQNGRTYLLGTLARVQVEHNVTTNYGKVIPHDPTKFKLYSQMVCSVPYMSVSVQQVLIP